MRRQVGATAQDEWEAGTWIVAVVLVLLAFAPRVYSQASLFDCSFAIGGGANGAVYSIVVQEDGKILVGGAFTEIAGQVHPHLARLHSNGQLDSSFSGGTDGPVYRLLRQPDGRILVGGSFSNLQGVARQSIGRLLTNGAVDANFDAGTLPGSEGSTFALGLQPDGKILVGNLASNGELFRLNLNGQLDSSFVQTNVFRNYHIFAICPRTNGSILVGGGFQGVNDFTTAGLALLGADGRLDTNYSSELQVNSNPFAIIEQTDGRVMVGGGFWWEGFTNKIVLARLTPELDWDLSFDPDSFDPSGSVPGFSYVTSMVPQPDGKMVLGGNFYEVGGYWRRGVVRLDSAGHVDPCFDPGIGLGGFVGPYTLARQSDGRILVGGEFIGDLTFTNIARLLPQSECNAMRVYLRKKDEANYFVAATCPPGGTNLFQVSSNLVNWITKDVKTTPYFAFEYSFFDAPAVFFRVKKEQ